MHPGIHGALQRILESRTFRRSVRHRRFLQYLVQSALVGEVENTREIVVGVNVFDRSIDTFDPRTDPIVRVEAGRLRDKLLRYYRDEGSGENQVIEIPVGGYLVHFIPRVLSVPLRLQDAADKAKSAIAIFPLDHSGTRHDDEMLCVGLADLITDILSRAPGWRVAARHSAMKAKAAGMQFAKIAKTLGVAYVLSGSLQRNGDEIRCIVTLSRARDERYLWSQRFQRLDTDAASVFEFQDAIAAAAAAAVRQADNPEPSPRPVVEALLPTTSNAEARDLFEQARYLAHKRTFESCEKAIEYLERAIVLDPRFARAHGELGLVNFSLAGLRSETPSRNIMAARLAVMRALKLDPKDGESLSLLASITFRVDRNWAVAEPLFVDALHHNRHASTIHMAFATCLAYNGRFDEAVEHARIARTGDPLNLALRAVGGSVACYASRYDQAIREQREVLLLEPDHLFSLMNLALASMAIGDLDVAENSLDRVCALVPHQPAPRFSRIACLGLRGRRDEATEKLEALLQQLAEQPYTQFSLATAQSAIGQTDAMYHTLDQSAVARDLLYASLPVHPLFRPHYREPRFLKQLELTGLRPVLESIA
jgi:TolB-like protein/Tfp pilus assembly protein PilF